MKISKENSAEKIKALRDCFSYLNTVVPQIGILSFYVPRHIVSTPDFTAAASKSDMYFGEVFFNMSKTQQVAVGLHELLHIVFQHCNRAEALGTTGGESDFNVAADLIINESVRDLNLRQITLPNEACFRENFLPDIDKASFHKLTVEQIYRMLKDKKDQQQQQQDQQQQQPSNSDSDENEEGGQSSNGSSSNKNSNSSDVGKTPTRKDLINKDNLKDISKDVVGSDNLQPKESVSDSPSEEIGRWSERIQQAKNMGSDGSPNLFANLDAELPRVKTKWQNILKSLTLKAIRSGQTRRTYSKPSRATMAGISPYYKPGLRKNRGNDTISVFLDLSGSCFTESIILECLANLQQVQRQTSSKLLVFTFDTKITGVLEIQNVEKQYKYLDWKGGGGTDFRPIFDQIITDPETGEKYDSKKFNTYIILTDLYGSYPDKKDIPNKKAPIIWAGISDYSDNFLDRVPYGRGIQMS